MPNPPELSVRPQRLIVMGTGPFAVPSFEGLRIAGHDIALVVTKPQPPVKSRKGPPPSPVRQWAEEHGLPVFDPVSINDDEAVVRISEIGASLLVVCDYGQILKPPALGSATLGGINLHGSLLPKYRGAAPVQWALLSGDEVTGVSVIHMTPRLDGGPIVGTRETAIHSDETAGQLEDRLAQMGVEATLAAVDSLSQWDGQSVIGEPQDSSLATKAPRLSKSDAEIDWGRTSREIDCHVRGMQPWPIAFTHCPSGDQKPPIRLAIKQIKILDESAADRCPGEIVIDDRFTVATGDQMIELQLLQPSGKREMAATDFLRGHRPARGPDCSDAAVLDPLAGPDFDTILGCCESVFRPRFGDSRMRSRTVWMIVVLLGLHTHVVRADEVSDKLDAILKEIKSLHVRVGRLELQVRELKKATAAPAPRPTIGADKDGGIPRDVRPFMRSSIVTPAEVIRLQQESPELLLKGIHERERLLRQRPFPADMLPVPFRIRP